ncbi:Toll-Interleukin-Resistance (TIR) domain family protein [Euphorbia peplus]|nr:Toll-Interleukin-Resistance (TIR) domain family protein [Euphorbia peplus]
MQIKAAFSTFKNMSHKLTKVKSNQMTPFQPRPACDVFINHRGIDTKRTIAGLLYDHLSRLGHKPFLDSKNMKPGDKLFEKIDPAIRECKIGVAVFSPRYCESLFCLHELALLMEAKKRVIPIFCDVKPSELRVVDDGRCPPDQLRRFSDALEEAKLTVGLTFDSNNGDWSEFLTTATFAILKNMIELEGHTFKNRKYFVQNHY